MLKSQLADKGIGGHILLKNSYGDKLAVKLIKGVLKDCSDGFCHIPLSCKVLPKPVFQHERTHVISEGVLGKINHTHNFTGGIFFKVEDILFPLLLFDVPAEIFEASHPHAVILKNKLAVAVREKLIGKVFIRFK